MAEALKACPFCGNDLYVRKGMNEYGRCDTPDCYMNARALSVPLDDPRQVEQWNRRASPILPADMREKVRAKIVEAHKVYIERNGRGHAPSKEWFDEIADAVLAILALAPPAVGVAEPVAVEAGDAVFGLSVVRLCVQHWIDFDNKHGGGPHSDDKHLVAPPVWPTHGQLKAWIALFARAEASLQPSARPSPDGEVERLREALEEARDEARGHLDDISAALGPGVRFMDPPDGGDVTLAQQVARMRAALSAAEAKLQAMEEEKALDRTGGWSMRIALVKNAPDLEAMRALVRQSETYKCGDTVLAWINEGDLYQPCVKLEIIDAALASKGGR